MSNLKDFLVKRRSRFYEGEELDKHVEEFLRIVDGGAIVHEYKDAIVVLEKYGVQGNYRGWLLFDKFTKGTATAMRDVTDKFDGIAIYASTHDIRIANLLKKFGYTEYYKDEYDTYLVFRR